MGNETSSEYHYTYDDKSTRGVRRSNSLRSNRSPTHHQSASTLIAENDEKDLTNNTNNKDAMVDSSRNVKKKNAPVKRSNTFTSISTFARPLFQSKLAHNDEATKKILWRNKYKTDVDHFKKQKKLKSSHREHHQQQQEQEHRHKTANEWTNETSSITDENADDILNTDERCFDTNERNTDNGQLFVPRKSSRQEKTASTISTKVGQQISTNNAVKVTISNGRCSVSKANHPTSSDHNGGSLSDISTSESAEEKKMLRCSSGELSLSSQVSCNRTIDSDVNTIIEEKPNILTTTKATENNTTAVLHYRLDDNTNNENILANAITGSLSNSRSSSIDERIERDNEKAIERYDNAKDDNLSMEEDSLNVENSKQTYSTSEGEDEGRKHNTPAEKRRNNVLRSRSMNYHMNRPKLSVEHRSNSIDEKLSEMESAKDSSKLSSSSTSKPPLGGRRSSDSSLLKEQHVKRSEQFSIMLKQFRQQREKRLKLSQNALGVITENALKEEAQAAASFRARRKSDYIDAWLKDQSRRIDVLADAVKGDAEKVRNLRASFRERSLKCPQKDLLPKRASSAKLPRRKNNNIASLISSSDSDELEDSFDVRKADNGCCYLDNNGNMITKKQQSTLKKQLSDTLMLVDNSFKNVKCKDTQKRHQQTASTEQQRLPPLAGTSQAVISSRNGHNVAVVKPMQRTNTDSQCATDEEGDSNNNEFITSTYNDVIQKTDFDKLTTVESTDVDESYTRKDVPNTEEEKNKEKEQVHDEIKTRTVKKRSDVDRISKSLDQVMGDLKTLRDQDIDIAKQLLGLGKSIKDFKKEQISGQSDIFLEDEDGSATSKC